MAKRRQFKLSEAIEGYWLDKRLEFSETTIPGYRLTFRRLVEFLNDAHINAVTSDDLRRFLLHLETLKLSKRTVHDCWIHLSSLWTWAEKELGVAHVIRGKIKQPPFTTRKINAFTQDEIKRIVKGVQTYRRSRNGKAFDAIRASCDRDLAIVLTLVDSGLRASELCALTIADYDQKRGRMRVQHGKMDKERFVIVGKRTQKAIWRYLTLRDDTRPNEPLFVTRNDTPIKRNELGHILKRVGERAAVPNTHPHRFRHTFAITFLRNGGSMVVLKELLGHETLAMVLHYAQVAEMDIDNASQHSPVDNWKL